MSEDYENETEAPEEAEVATFDRVYTGINPDPDKAGCIEIVARKDGKEAVVYYDFGDDIEDMVDMFGDNVVFTNARSKMKIGLQAGMRSYMKAGQSIEKLMANYKPGVSLEKLPADMNKATEDYFAGLDESEQDAMIARLMERKSA